ncbi:CPBP family intramembrane glutamic endopeptidase [Haloplanus sp. GCM10025708]|uniref:CPBP family intramembrane glutamic endopeptidase n=1 Tax=Haloferacaceae TaxID=1644056 RepID=UPI00361828B6
MFHRPSELQSRRILVFLGVAFGVAWAVAGVIYATGGLRDSPQLLDSPPITLATALLATGYMWAPALANVATRRLTGEGWTDLGLRPHVRASWRYWVAAWIGPAFLTLVGVGVYFLVFPEQFDPSLGAARQLLGVPAGTPLPFGLSTLVALYLAQAVLLAPLLNAPLTFGEEFGWRGYLLPKLLPLGWRRAVVVLGVVWGVWHWPVIAMGYNYGFDYPGAPWLGLLAMVWFTFVVGTFLAWVTVRAESVWPATIGHAAVNGVGAAGLLFVRGRPNALLGPTATGVLTTVAWAAVALYLCYRPPDGS